MKAQKNPTRRMLQNQCYDLLVANFKPESKFYTSDCDAEALQYRIR